MTSAITLLSHPEKALNPLTPQTSSPRGYTSDEIAHFRIGHDDIRNLFIKIYNFGPRNASVITNLRPAVTDAVFEDSIDKPNTFTLVVHDPDWELLNTGALNHTVDLNPGKIPHLWYRLDAFSVNNDDITLTFMTRNAVYLSYHKKPYKISRNKVTRAQFILTLLHHVKKTRIKLYCPQLTKKQKQAKFQSQSERERSSSRGTGFTPSDKITVKGQPASEQQKTVIGKVIEAGEDVNAPGLVVVSAVMCVIQESTASENPQPPNPPFV